VFAVTEDADRALSVGEEVLRLHPTAEVSITPANNVGAV